MATFKFGTTSLTNFGRVTLIDDYLDMAARRGENIIIPYMDGAIHTQKYFDQRKIIVGIAVIAATATALETAFDTMKTLFSPRTQQILEMTLEDTSVRNAYATVDTPLQVERVSSTIARVVVEFTLTSPYFQGASLIADNTVIIDTSPHAMTVTNTGNVEERNPTITIDGPFTSITITNSTNGAVLTYTGAIGAAENVVIGTLNGEFYATLSTGSVNVIGNVTHSGSSTLMPINVGANTLAITSDGGDNTGTVKISFYPKYL
jgi:hypothetical protein